MCDSVGEGRGTSFTFELRVSLNRNGGYCEGQPSKCATQGGRGGASPGLILNAM